MDLKKRLVELSYEIAKYRDRPDVGPGDMPQELIEEYIEVVKALANKTVDSTPEEARNYPDLEFVCEEKNRRDGFY